MRAIPLFLALTLFVAAAAPTSARAADDWPLAGTQYVEIGKPFDTFVTDLKAAIKDNGLGIVAEACATCGAEKIGVTIPGNRVIMVFHPKYAVRMLAASIPAGIEAPLRLYVMEAADGTARLAYRRPTAVFAPYDNAELDAMAAELDAIVTSIVRDARMP